MKNALEQIKLLKSEKGITNAELSALSGVPLGTVNKILSGATKSIKAETLDKLYSALNVSISFSKKSPLTHGFCKVGACTPNVMLASVNQNDQSILN